MSNPPSSSGVRAVLFATARAAADLPVPTDFPAALLPLGHATLINRVVEQVVRSGVTEIDIVACDRPELLRLEVGEGERWGIRLQWHLAKDHARPYAALRSAGLLETHRVLIGHVDRWIDPAMLPQLAEEERIVLGLDDKYALSWAGWASVPGHALASLRADIDERTLGADLSTLCPRTLVLERGRWFSPLDCVNLLRAQRSVIAGSADAPLPATWIPTPWGAMSPGARVHPRATIDGPVLIGPGCLIAEGASVGPNAVLSRDVVVCAGTHVRESVVLPGTYLGRGLDVNGSIVNGGRIRHVELGVETVLAPSDGLALSLSSQRVAGPSAGGRILAVVAATALAPLVAAAALVRRRDEALLPWTDQAVVAGLDSARRIVFGTARRPRANLSTLRRAAARYGGLLDVAQGRLCWFGVRPRRGAEWYALSPEWQTLLANSPIGLLNAPAWAEERFTRIEALAAADAFYAVQRGWRENLRVSLAALRAARSFA
jgi:hypothetical protein